MEKLKSLVVDGIIGICALCKDFEYDGEIENWHIYDEIMELEVGESLTPEFLDCINILWENEESIKKTFERRSESVVYEIDDKFEIYLKKLTEIDNEDYFEPTWEDKINLGKISKGIEEIKLINHSTGTNFVIYHVHNDINIEKSAHMLDDMLAIMYMADLSLFDEYELVDGVEKNRLVLEIEEFERLINNPIFVKFAVILLLNKRDLFRKKIEIVGLGDIPAFADYNGTPNHYDEGIEYLSNKFLERNKNYDRHCFHFVTDLKNTDDSDFNASYFFNICKEIILKQNLEDDGFTD